MNRMAAHIIIAGALISSSCFADGGDTYNASNNQVIFPTITVGNTTYTNVVITVGQILSVGGSYPACTTPLVLTNGACSPPAPPSASSLSEGGLTWMPVAVTLYPFAQATTLCSGTINSQGGWRLPTSAELSALYAAYPSNSSVLMNLGWTLAYTWSSTPASVGNHYNVSLQNGNVNFLGDAYASYVLCVR